ncbi:MAG TPA: cytochrome c [Candidatus Elarobacter sp.]|jgi:mono/diheme cytochrome c family protein|nr:cytochrome c [Candidatus Elarobacter sp.]
MQSKPLAFLAAGAIAALIAAGCTKGSDQSSSSSTTTTSTTSSAPAAASSSSAMSTTQGDAAHGKQIFAANCTQCHGQTGTEGGIGPPLKNEKSRKNYAQTIAWIKNPQPPMPKLYPSPLSEKDVDDVAAYVQSL